MLDEAINVYKGILTKDPSNVMVRLNLGEAYYGKGLCDEAISEFENIIKTNPDNTRALYKLGEAYADRGLLDKSAVMYNKSITSNISFPGSLRQAGCRLSATGTI